MTSFVTEPLRREHDRSAFHSGVAALDRYLQLLALQDVKRRVAGCFVAVAENIEIAGFYTLAATHVLVEALPPDVTRRLPRIASFPRC